jgi:hypothetical protein
MVVMTVAMLVIVVAYFLENCRLCRQDAQARRRRPSRS